MSKKRRQSKAGKMIASFMLFLSLTVLSLSVCCKAYIANPATIACIFTGNSYVSALQDDIIQFANDESKKCSVPADCLDKVISYDVVFELESSYIHSMLGTSQGYSADAFQKNVLSLKEKISTAMQNELDSQNMSYSQKGVEGFAQAVSDYAQSKAEFKYIEKVQSVLNISNVLITAAIIVSLVVSIALIALLVVKKDKRYRSMRYVAYSFEASAIFNFAMVCAVGIVRGAKDLVLYPSYLCAALMSYVGSSMLAVAISGIVLILISFVIITAIWRIKRGNE